MAFKTILFHKGVQFACIPIAGVTGVGVGVEKAPAIKKAYHRVVGHTPKKVVRHHPRRVAASPIPVECAPIGIGNSPILLSNLNPIAPLMSRGYNTTEEPNNGSFVNEPSYPGAGFYHPTPVGGGGGFVPGTPGNPGIPGTPGEPTIPTPVPTATSTVPGAVPEPATWAMMVSGMGLIGHALRRGKSKKTSAA
jgi:hypothetical protein